MRRGRPTAAPQPQPQPQAATASSAKNSDPFSALDSASNTIRSRAVDELSAKFPSLDEFSIAHESGGFNFSSSKPKKVDPVTSALADDLFARPASANATPPPRIESAPARTSSKPITKSETSVRVGVPPKPKTLLHQPAPQRPGYSSAGTMTSPAEAQPSQPILPKMPDVSKRPIWRVPEPDHSRASSQPRASPLAQIEADRLQPNAPPAQRPALLDSHRSKSQTATLTMAKQTTSSRPSLEGHRPSFRYEDGISRTRSANSRPRPVSAAYVDSNLDYLREQEAERKRPSLEIRRSSRSFRGNEVNLDDANIDSDADYLRSLEGNGGLSRRSSGKSVSHNKRSSMSALSFSGTKNMLTGRFNDAFKRFEQTGGEVKSHKSGRGSESGFRTPSPSPQMQTESNLLSPISGSDTNETPRRPEVVNSNLGDLTETEDLPPEMRREMERLQLAQEEKRVAAAKAEHRTRGGAPPVPSKANMIQQRVQSLLDDGQKSPVRKRQAEGYGRYTERTEAMQPELQPTLTAQPTPKKQAPPIARKPATPVPTTATAPGEVDMNLRYHKVRQSQSFPIPAGTYPLEHSVSAPAQRTGAVPRPNAPAKPAALKTGGSASSQGRPQSSGMASPVYSQPSRAARGPSLAALMARDNEGVAGVGAGNNSGMDQGMRPESDFANQADFDDWQADFSKRYPSLSGIEMVEREIAGTGGGRDGGRRGMRVRDV
jgi:AP2-associated kinase